MAESVYAVVLCLLGAAAMPILTKKYRALLISSQSELKWQSVPPCASYASTGQNRFLLGRMEHVRNTSIIISLVSNDSICPSYSGALETNLGKRLTPLATLYHMFPFKQANGDRRAKREHKKNTWTYHPSFSRGVWF